jgi:hypothetical protein
MSIGAGDYFVGQRPRPAVSPTSYSNNFSNDLNVFDQKMISNAQKIQIKYGRVGN